MQIDLVTGNTSTNLSKAELSKLTRQMANVLLTLEIPTNKTVQVQVGEITPISRDERLNLILQLKKQPNQQALIDLLRKPDTKLVELKLHQRLVHVITDIPLKLGQLVLIRPTVSHLSTPQIITQTSDSGAPSIASNQPGKFTTQTGLERSVAGHSVTTPTTAANELKVSTATGINAQPANSKSPLPEPNPPLLVQKLPSDKANRHAATDLTTIPSAKANPEIPGRTLANNSTLSPTEPSVIKTTAAAQPAGQPVQLIDKVHLPSAETKRLAQNVMRQSLPVAQPLARAAQSFIERIWSAQQHQASVILPKTAKPEVLNFAEQLKKLVSQPLILTPGRPLSAKSIAQAIENSGVFYEAKLRQQINSHGDTAPFSTLKSLDNKAVLLLLESSINQLLTVVPASGMKSVARDAVDKLLANILLPSATKTRSERELPPLRLEQLANITKQALAQVQIRQIQALSGSLSEQHQATGIPMDIPLRFGDGLFNLFLFFFDPESRKQSEKKRHPGTQQRQRWKLFMTLNLEECGDLSAELLVNDESLDATLWASNNSLRQATQAHLGQLKADLLAQGLTVHSLHCATGMAPEPATKTPGPLIDIET